MQSAPPALRVQVLVIGAGMAGASAAAEVARHRSVLLLEMEDQPGRHSTGRSAALFDETYGNATVRALTRASRAFLEAPPAGFCEAPLLTPRGLLLIARHDQVDRLAAAETGINGTGGGLRRIAAAEARRRVPALRPERLAAALLDEQARDLDVHGLHQGYLAALRAHGGRLITSARVESLERRGATWLARAGEHRVSADQVINAAGAWADEVGALAGAMPIGLSPLRRTAVLVEPPADLPVAGWPMVLDVGEELYFKPDAGRLLVSPADQTPSPPCDARPDELDVAVAIERLQEACDLKVERVAHRWAGLRSFVADRTPVVGFDPRVPGFLWLAGQGGYGIGTAPAMARLAAALTTGREPPPEVAGEGVSFADLSPLRLLGPPA